VHAAGVIHRDIKPDNVIVGADGRVRLGDFGLARSGAASTSPAPTTFALGTVSGGTAVAGTPAYMAPEVLRGGAADAASDQFSFGVMAYELLAGKRPFDGATWADLLRSIEHHDPEPLPNVPSWVDDVIRRALAVEPAKRFASMRAIADTLHQRTARRHPAFLLAGGLAVALLASGATWLAVRDKQQAPTSCDIGGAQIAATWTQSTREYLIARGAPAAAIAVVDTWTHAWRDERDAACKSASRDNPQRVASRERCLDQRHAELAALLHAAVQAPDRLLDAVVALPSPAECRNADADPLPLDPRRTELAKQVLARLPAVRASVAIGNDPDERYSSQRLVEDAHASGHQPTIADALLVHADALRVADQLDDAALAARDAVIAAELGHADMLRARAWVTRVAIAGDQRDLAVADDLGAIAAAAIERIGAPQLRAQLTRLRGLIAYNRGELAVARELLLDARKQLVALAGERSLDIATVDSALGSVARAAGDLDEAERRHRSVLALDRELRGPSHRDIARDLHNIAGVLRLRGDLDRALATYREALAVEVATQGANSVAAALTHNSIGLVELARKDYPAARDDFERAREILSAVKHGDLAFAEHNLGLVKQANGESLGAVAEARNEHKRALAHFTTAAAVYAKTIGADALAPMRLDLDRARSELALGLRDQAREHATLARDRARAADITWLADDATAFLANNPAPVRVSEMPEPVTAPPKPVPSKPPAPKPQPKKDVGVYGSAQTW